MVEEQEEEEECEKDHVQEVKDFFWRRHCRNKMIY